MKRKDIKILKGLLAHLSQVNGDRVWGQTMAFFISAVYTAEQCKAIAKKLIDKYPYFSQKLADNYGYDLVEFIS